MEEKNKATFTKKLPIIIIILAVVGLIFIVFTSNRGEAVAEVNGQIIKSTDLEKEFELTLNSAESGGQEVTDEQREGVRKEVLDAMINEILINNYLDDNNISITQDEVEEEYNLLVASVGDEEKLKNQLDLYKMTKEDLLINIEKNLAFKKALEIHSSSDDSPEEVEISEEDIRSAYDEILQNAINLGIEEQVPPFSEETREALRQQIIQEKEFSRIESFIDFLRNQADIKIYL